MRTGFMRGFEVFLIAAVMGLIGTGFVWSDGAPLKLAQAPSGSPAAPLEGTWYELALDCSFCLKFEEHTVSLTDKETVLRFSDRMEISSSPREAYFFTKRGTSWLSKTATWQSNDKKGQFIIFDYIQQDGVRSSDVFARIWVLSPMADSKILFGRRYLVYAFTDAAYETTEKGFRAKESFLGRDVIVANLDDVRVSSLNGDRKNFQPSDQVRFGLDGVVCYVREEATEADIARANAESREVSARYQKRVELYRTLIRQGDQAYHAADYEDALNRYKAASAILGEDPLVHSDLGAVYQVQKKLPEAEAAYRLAIELDNSDADSRYNLAQILEQMDRLNDALAMYRIVLEMRPDDAETNERIVKLQRKIGG